MTTLLTRIRKNGILLLVAALTAALFIYPYLKPASSSGLKKEDAARPTPVQVSPVRRGRLVDAYQAVATLQGRIQIPILAQVDGVLTKVYGQLGTTVRQGQPLALLDNRLQRAALQLARTQLGRSTDELGRVSTLAGRQLVSQTRLQAVTGQQALDAAEVTRLTTLLALTRFASPLTGLVTQQQVEAGSTVRVGDHLFTVSDISRLLLITSVPETIAAHLHRGDTVTLQGAPGSAPLAGRIQLVAPVADPISHLVSVEIDAGRVFPRLKPGYQVQVDLPAAVRTHVLILDRRALTDDPQTGEATVFVAVGGKARKRTVRLGLVLDEGVELLSGLALGDLVIYRGLERLRDGSSVQVIPAISTRTNP